MLKQRPPKDVREASRKQCAVYLGSPGEVWGTCRESGPSGLSTDSTDCSLLSECFIRANPKLTLRNWGRAPFHFLWRNQLKYLCEHWGIPFKMIKPEYTISSWPERVLLWLILPFGMTFSCEPLVALEERRALRLPFIPLWGNSKQTNMSAWWALQEKWQHAPWPHFSTAFQGSSWPSPTASCFKFQLFPP